MSSSESPSPQRIVPGFKIDPMETEPMIKSSYADLFGSQLNALTNKEQIIGMHRVPFKPGQKN